ncbi:MAG: translational GTPase TypA [Rickettsiales bacterium]|jgi:GTP-binding protein|nr:translational GTPase TypA [Rickettsiales bacterium]
MKIRNIAIIAHVDHGKTTLVDQLLRQSGTFESHEEITERLMDNNELEKERGITILAKCTSINYKDYKINIVDTPGHADFGGEVERVLSMVDGVALLVDSAEGPLPQTKFVLSKALALGIKPMVIINKIDRNDARPDDVLNEIFDLFVNLGASDEQLDFPVLYAVGRDGWCVNDLKDVNISSKDLTPLFDLIVSHVPEPKIKEDNNFSMLATILDKNAYLGRMLTGKIYSGAAKINMPIKAINLAGEIVEKGKLTKMFSFKGIKKIAIEEASAGDIISLAGLSIASVADTICDLSNEIPIKSTPVDAPTMSIMIGINDSPYAGQEGTKVTSRMIRERLFAEAETNVAITVKETPGTDTFEIGGRGELQLGVLVETMRREGFELSVGRPRVLFKYDENGNKLEPIEEVIVDVDDEYAGTVVEKLSKRKGEMQEMKPCGVGKTRIVFFVPSRGLLGYQSEFLTDTRGTGVINKIFNSYKPYKGDIPRLRKGVLISTDMGVSIPYAIFNLQSRGKMFVGVHEKVYEGMIVGEHSRDNDIIVNILREKKLTNVRAASSDENVILVPPTKMSLEQMMTYINDDELIEVTPKNLRLRKKYLSAQERKKYNKNEEME